MPHIRIPIEKPAYVLRGADKKARIIGVRRLRLRARARARRETERGRVARGQGTTAQHSRQM
eukprot:6748341-Prymnesium_polylepis.1